MGEIKGFQSVIRDGERDVGGHGEVSGACHDGQDTTDTVHDGDQVGQSKVSICQRVVGSMGIVYVREHGNVVPS